MKIICLWLLVIFTILNLQTSFLALITLNAFTPNLMILMVVSFAWIYGDIRGVAFGFVASFLQDITSTTHFGITMFSYMTLGLLFGKLSTKINTASSLLPIISSIPAIFLHYLIMMFFLFLLSHEVDINIFVSQDFWKMVIMQLIFALPINKVVYLLHYYSNDYRRKLY